MIAWYSGWKSLKQIRTWHVCTKYNMVNIFFPFSSFYSSQPVLGVMVSSMETARTNTWSVSCFLRLLLAYRNGSNKYLVRRTGMVVSIKADNRKRYTATIPRHRSRYGIQYGNR